MDYLFTYSLKRGFLNDQICFQAKEPSPRSLHIEGSPHKADRISSIWHEWNGHTTRYLLWNGMDLRLSDLARKSGLSEEFILEEAHKKNFSHLIHLSLRISNPELELITEIVDRVGWSLFQRGLGFTIVSFRRNEVDRELLVSRNQTAITIEEGVSKIQQLFTRSCREWIMEKRERKLIIHKQKGQDSSYYLFHRFFNATTKTTVYHFDGMNRIGKGASASVFAQENFVKRRALKICRGYGHSLEEGKQKKKKAESQLRNDFLARSELENDHEKLALSNMDVILLKDGKEIFKESRLTMSTALSRGSLDALTALTDQWSVKKKLTLLHRAAEELQDFHRRGWAHGDIKPENILLHDDHLRFSDWGGAQRINGKGDSTGSYTRRYALRSHLMGIIDPLMSGEKIDQLRQKRDCHAFSLLAWEWITHGNGLQLQKDHEEYVTRVTILPPEAGEYEEWMVNEYWAQRFQELFQRLLDGNADMNHCIEALKELENLHLDPRSL